MEVNLQLLGPKPIINIKAKQVLSTQFVHTGKRFLSVLLIDTILPRCNAQRRLRNCSQLQKIKTHRPFLPQIF